MATAARTRMTELLGGGNRRGTYHIKGDFRGILQDWRGLRIAVFPGENACFARIKNLAI